VTPDPGADLVDRAALVRRALRSLVAERGFHGASMSAVARHAGVATGTAYTHYASKDALVLAAYRETKEQLGAAATSNLDPSDPPQQRFRQMWLATHRHLAYHPGDARFILQVDHSPYRHELYAAVIADDEPLLVAVTAPDVAAQMLPLPLEVIWELGLAPAVRLAAIAREIPLDDQQLADIANACWRAVSGP
jgi:AcrR family transcriptional regulator